MKEGNQLGRLKDKVIVIGGGTKGIGAGIGVRCAQEGACVVLSGRDQQAGERVCADLHEMGAEALFVQVDLARVEDCARLIESAEKRFGRVDGLVNNAAIFPRATLAEADEEHFDRVFAVNTKGPFFCCSAAILAMRRGGGGSIVNVGSTHAWAGGSDLAAYACSKGALHTLTMHIAKNYANEKIRSNWVTVGWVETPGEMQRIEQTGRDAAWLKSQGESRVPLGRLQTPDDIAHGVVYLLSDESSQVTGTDLHVSGGFTPV